MQIKPIKTEIKEYTLKEIRLTTTNQLQERKQDTSGNLDRQEITCSCPRALTKIGEKKNWKTKEG